MEHWQDNNGTPPPGHTWVKALYRSGWECTARADQLIWSTSAGDPIEKFAFVKGGTYTQVLRIKETQ